MTEWITWLSNHWDNIVQVIAFIIAAASIVVKWTPTIKDDNWLLATIKFLSKYVALNRTVDDAAIRAQSAPAVEDNTPKE